MAAPDELNPLTLFKRTLDECRELYVSSGQLCAQEFPDRLPKGGDKFVQLMDDLHRALLVKVYFTVCEADRQWSEAERYLAGVLFDHLWNQRLSGEKLRAAARQTAQDASKLKWYAIVRPFDQIVPLRDRVGTLETLVMRLANLVARADGKLNDKESAIIRSLQEELRQHLRPIPIDEPTQHEEPNALSEQAIESLKSQADDFYAVTRPNVGPPSRGGQAAKSKDAADMVAAATSRPQQLGDALAELDNLIGLEKIKHEVRTLTNYLKLQQRRGKAGLPDIDMSLHMVFTGNPGTGKTTVARIVGKILGALGILKKGHLVETDRSGMVAEYMGQSAPKTQAKINEALDGVLFIDEAYSLAPQEAQDVYGGEAVQTLLKRAEDDRARLVVILAGYPDEMDAMLKSNPGLSSRFNRVLHFEDYSPVELARIFGWLCKSNHYKLADGTRAKLMLGLSELHRRRDRHFGNGRAVRNVFEHAVRRMANRIADIAELSQDQLMLLEAGDIEFSGLPPDACLEIDATKARFQVACPKCGHGSKAPGEYLGKKVRCRKCEHNFLAEWGEVVCGEMK
jgi:SpoVK/Ycf46/Vps4 family AAA+-type ATPase